MQKLNTRIFTATEGKLKAGELAEVISVLKSGGVAALPTETVYGLAANALNEAAVKKIFLAKGRPQDNPLIVHVSSIKMAERVADGLPESARRLANRFWPGPLTMVVKKSGIIPLSVSAGLNSVGIRLPSHPVMLAVISGGDMPLAAPSANISGRPSPTNAGDCMEDLMGLVDVIVDGGPSAVGVESTIVSLLSGRPRLLRPGAITLSMLKEELPDIEVDSAVMGEMDERSTVAAPGMRYRHYAPNARVQLILGSSEDYCEYVNRREGEPGVFALGLSEDAPLLKLPSLELGGERDIKTISRRLFWSLRELDRKGAKTVLAHCPGEDGEALAVYNRLLRAAAFDVVKL